MNNSFSFKTMFSKILGLDVQVDSTKEKKRIVLVNTMTGLGVLFCAMFIVLDIVQQKWELLPPMVVLSFLCLVIYVLNRKKFYKTARFLLILSTFSYFFYSSISVSAGTLSEFFYLLILLAIMLFTDKLYLQVISLVLLIIAFYVPNIVLEIYPEDIFGYANMSVLFISLFLITRHFISLNQESEKKLQEDNKTINKQNKELEKLQLFQKKFFENISHDIRTPLTIINGNTNKINKADNKITEVITQQTHKITRLLDDLVDLSKIDSGNLKLDLEPVNVNHVMTKTFHMFESYFDELNIDLNLGLPQEELWAQADEIYLERCLMNLVQNASKFTEEYGSVSLFLREKEEVLHLVVEDTGIGIKTEDSLTIFERFTQLDTSLNAQGTGVGLNFVKECVELMNGEIKVASEESLGTYFTLSIPKSITAKPKEISPVVKEEVKKEIGKTNHKILLVEDNSDMMEYLSGIFKSQTLFKAYNGTEALSVLAQEEIDCVITDYMMPEMDGLELLKSIKEKKYESSVVMLTANTNFESKLSALRLGVDDYLNKPFSDEELLLRVEKLFKNKKNRIKSKEKFKENKGVLPPFNVRDSFLTQLQEVIEKEPDLDSFTTVDLAERLNVSSSTLLRSVKNCTGLTAKQYLKEVGLQRARVSYEKNPEENIKLLAGIAGVKNQTYFAEEFLKRFGVDLRERK